jgi:hypothetical protein
MSAENTPPKGDDWIIVSQVKSNRVVYFTDDPEYQPPMQGDWCYASPYQGKLPKGMNLRNCWRWRFNGMAFTDAGKPRAADKSATLLAHNRQTLLDLLAERIQALRQPLEPSTPQGHELRARKQAAAKAYLAGETAEPILLATAAAHNTAVAAMAHLVLALGEERDAVLAKTEELRETLSVAIRRAGDQTELLKLRERIMNEVAADRLEPHPTRPSNTTPSSEAEVVLSKAALEDERLRLRLQLRNRINDLRRPWISHYLLDEAITARKAELANTVLRAGGAIPTGIDGSLLLSHAAARGQSIVEAAQEIQAELRQQRNALIATEAMKDAMLARIAMAEKTAEINAIGRDIAILSTAKDGPGSQTDALEVDPKHVVGNKERIPEEQLAD